MEGDKVAAIQEKDGSYSLSEGHVLCDSCEGSGTQSCEDCSGEGSVTRECEMGYEHTEDCGSCDEGTCQCFACDGQGEVVDPDIELDYTL